MNKCNNKDCENEGDYEIYYMCEGGLILGPKTLIIHENFWLCKEHLDKFQEQFEQLSNP